MDVVLNEEDSYIIYLYFFFSSLLLTRLRWMWSSMRKTRILYICIFFLQFIAKQTEMDVVLNEEDSYIIYLYFFFPVYCEPDWDGCGPQWGRLILPGTSTPSVGACGQSRPRPAQPEEVRVLPAALHSDHHLHQAEAPAPVLPLPYRGAGCTDGPPCACDLSSPFQEPWQDDLWWVGT